MSNLILPKIDSKVPQYRTPPESVDSLESLIEDLDQRGLLVLSILLGQQAMKILTEDTEKILTSSTLVTKTKDTTNTKNMI